MPSVPARRPRFRHHVAFTLALALLLNLLPLSALTSTAQERPRAAAQESSPILAEFKEWVEQFKLGGTTAASADKGEELARRRREVMARLVEEDPRSAVELAVPARVRQKLPEEIRQHVEQEVSGYGDYLVFIYDEADPQTGEFTRSRTERKVVLGGQTYEARVYGRKEGMTTKLNIPLRGVVVGDRVALAESPVRLLDEDERVSGPGSPGVDAEVGGKVLHFESREELDRFGAELEKREMTIGPSAGAPAVKGADAPVTNVTPDSPWTEGAKTILVMRVDFSDVPGEPVDVSNIAFTLARGQTFITELGSFYKTNSYNKTNITGAVTPVLRMPQTAAWYGSNNKTDQLLIDARAAALAAGLNTANYNLDVVIFKRINDWSWAGLGALGGKGSWLNGYYNLRESSHEIGHNYGLNHANLWKTTDGTPIGTGTSQEYGNPFDSMGANGDSTGTRHFGAWYKNYLNWLPDADVLNVAAGGTYRLQAYDSGTAAGRRALKIQKDANTYYWVEFRQAILSNAALLNGAVVYWGYTTNKQSNLLDMVPTNADPNDAPLVVGQTMTDTKNGIKITAVAKTTSVPAQLDVNVTFTTNLGALTVPSAVAGGSTVTATVSLNAPAPTAGALVTLSDDLPATTLPASVTIPAGVKSKTFTFTTKVVTANQAGTVKANYRGVEKSAALTLQPTALSSLTLSKSPIGGGGALTGTVTLNGPAPAGGAVVTLSDNIAATTLPASVTVPAGAKTKLFQITTVAVTASQSGNVTGSYGGVSKSAALTVAPLGLESLTVNPASAAGGVNVTGTVTLNAKAPAGGLLVTLSDNIAATTVPANVTVPAGATSKTFTITSALVAASQTGNVSAKYGAVTKTAALTIRPAALSSITLDPASVAGGNSVTGTVTLDGPAPAAGAAVTLSDNLAATTVPAKVTVPSGASSKTFTITTAVVSARQTGTVTAVFAGVTKTAPLAVRLMGVQSITVNQNPIVGGSNATATVTLDRLPASNTVVTLSDNLAATTIPATITVPANTLTKTFTITTTFALPSQRGTLNAALNGETRSLSLSVVNTQLQLLANPGFELGRVSWIVSSPGGIGKVIENSNGQRVNSGLWDGWLGGYSGAVSESLYQQVTIPADAITADLNFYLWLPTTETTTTLANDTLKVQIQNGSGAVLATPVALSNLDRNGWFTKKTVNLLPYRGQTIRVFFLSNMGNDALTTWFYLDDITLDVIR